MIYFSNFGAAAGGDPHFSNVKFLSGFEGSDAVLGTVLDESGNANDAVGNGTAEIDTAQFKFGTSSLYLPSAAYVEFSSDALKRPLLDIGANQFCIEAWVRFAGTSGEGSIINHTFGTAGNASWALRQNHTSNLLEFHFRDTGGTARSVTGSFTASANTWYHLAAERDGSNVLRLYVDGVVVGSATRSETFRDGGATSSRIGEDVSASSRPLNGWVDECRVTIGASRYGGAFTPPTAAFPRS